MNKPADPDNAGPSVRALRFGTRSCLEKATVITLSAINEPERYAEGWMKRMAGSVIPAGVAQVARTIDPTMREAEGILDAVRARVPDASKALLPRRDIFGHPVIGQGGVGPDIVSPIWQTERRTTLF